SSSCHSPRNARWVFPRLLARSRHRCTGSHAPHGCPSCDVYPMGRRTRPGRRRDFTRREEPMSDTATMLQETVEAFADLRTMLDGLTEEQASRIRLGVLGVRDLVIQWPGMLRRCGGRISQAAERAESLHQARLFWAPGSFWGLRCPADRN